MEEEGYLDEVLISLKLTDIHWYSLIFTDIEWYFHWDWLICSLILATSYQGPVVVVVCGGNLVSTSLVRPGGEIWRAGLWLLSRWRSGGRRLFEGVVGRCQEELYHFQMSPFHCIVVLFMRFLNIVCYQLYQSDVTHLKSLPPWNKW